jgi:hypothetical protein
MSGAECAQRRESTRHGPFSISRSNPHISRCLLFLARTKLPLDSTAKCRSWDESECCRMYNRPCNNSSLEWPLPLDSQSVFTSLSPSVGCSTLYFVPLWMAGPAMTMAAHFSPKPEKIWPSRLGDGSAIIY